MHDVRRGTRISCKIPVILTSYDSAHPVSDPCLVILANPHGCAARFGRPLEIGTVVQLEGLPARNRAMARVVNCISVEDHKPLWLLGLELNETGNVWGIQSPPEDWQQNSPSVLEPLAKDGLSE